MKRAALLLALLVALGASLVPFFALVGLAAHRHASAWATTAAATLLLYGPPLGMALASRRDRPLMLASAVAAWSLALFLVLPVYFPGERNQAVATGLGLVGVGSDRFGLPARLAATLPDEPAMATPEVAEAETLKVDVPAAAGPLADDQIALPYEGEGRRMSVPVIFGNAGRDLEVDMMFDTGATYTTLPVALLEKLGVEVGPDDPTIQLHTANGERDARVVLVDQVWLGDLAIEGVAIATCDDCASADTAGLLGLNVAGGFNVAIDADRREVLFTNRRSFDRKLDVKPFTDLSATFTRFPGGRVEVAVRLENLGRRPIDGAATSIRCDGDQWLVELAGIRPGEVGQARRKLPQHEPCEQYEIALHSASW